VRDGTELFLPGGGSRYCGRSWQPTDSQILGPVVRMVYSGDEALARRTYPASHQSDRLVAKDASVST
jgi:hypothetical protein